MQGNLASVMEYVPGGSLRLGLQKLQRTTGATHRLRASIALQAARGERALHTPRRVRHFLKKASGYTSQCHAGGLAHAASAVLMRPVLT